MEARKAYKLAKNNIKCCYLCEEEKIKIIVCFVPDDPTKWVSGKPAPGRKRTFWYGLCEECLKLLDKAELVEKKMVSELN